MKKIIVFLVMSVLVQSAFADSWEKRIECENGSFVVDGLHSYDQGFKEHQVVIRSRQAVDYLTSRVGTNLSNSSGEMVVGLNSSKFDGKFQAQIAKISANPNYEYDNYFYSLNGQWLGVDRYEVYVTMLRYYPGASYHQPIFVANWVFNNCHWIH